MGLIVLLEGFGPEAAQQHAEELRIKNVDMTGRTPEELLQELREKSILPPRKGSEQ
jgi:hypothetical protein